MSFNVDKCSVMHIGHNNMQSNYNMSNQQLPTTDQQQDLGFIITKDLKWQKQIEKSCKTTNTEDNRVQVQKQRSDHPFIQIPRPPTSRTCSGILFPTFKARNQKPHLPPANPGP